MASLPGWQKLATQKAKKYGLDPKVFVKQIQQESGGNPKAKSSAGAIGIAQIVPSTAKAWGVNPNDPVASLDVAAKNMAGYVKKYGSYKQALSAYNSGSPTGYKKIAETANYVKTILGGSTPKATTSSAPSTASGDSDLRKQAALAYLQSGETNPLGLVYRYQALKDANPTPTVSQAPTSALKASGGVVDFGGKQVSSGIAPILQYARQKGWQGQVTSGYRTDKDQLRIYQSGVRPAAVPKALGGGGSNHERTGWLKGAVDVTDPEQLDKILRRKNSRLQWAGAKDPVHFSFPKDGSY